MKTIKILLAVLMVLAVTTSAMTQPVSQDFKGVAKQGGVVYAYNSGVIDSAFTSMKKTGWVDISSFDNQTIYMTAVMTGDAAAGADTMLFIVNGRMVGNTLYEYHVDTLIITKSAGVFIQTTFVPNIICDQYQGILKPVGANSKITNIFLEFGSKQEDPANSRKSYLDN